MKLSIKLILITCLLQVSLAIRAQQPTNQPGQVFPESDYTPNGYLDNSWHASFLHPSGLIRSVPPLGFGFWCRELPMPYGMGAWSRGNYLSFLELGICQDGTTFVTTGDFEQNKVSRVSRYHTKNSMSYNWEFNQLAYDIKYLYPSEDAIACVVTVKNSSGNNKTFSLHATNVYGFSGQPLGDSYDMTALYQREADAGMTKVIADGDIFLIGSDVKSSGHKATASESEWKNWVRTNDQSSNKGATSSLFNNAAAAVYNMLTYQIEVPAGKNLTFTLVLARGKNEPTALKKYAETLKGAPVYLSQKMQEDDLFYRNTPLLSGDWPESWKHGWIYDFETLRMNVREPAGIFKHRWDGMQIYTPRTVLGETAIDALCLSYASPELAKEVLMTIFADAISPNLPCTREDGSVNMVVADGTESGTSPNWCMPFFVIQSIYERNQDYQWLTTLYPYLKSYINWWLKNRTDKDGWLHANNSWESGQDGGKRFLNDGNSSASAEHVRTVDIEAAMAHAMLTMQQFARITGNNGDIAYWEKLSAERLAHVSSMFVDGWYHDVDARNGKPIYLDYDEIMMLFPVSVGVTPNDQIKQLLPKFNEFVKKPELYQEWPSYVLPFTEAAWNAGLRMLSSEEVTKLGNRVYPRWDKQDVKYLTKEERKGPYPDHYTYQQRSFPEQYVYQLPGISREWWPLADSGTYLGCEGYGWGATIPTLVIRNIIGFRELTGNEENGFNLSPSVPNNLASEGQTLGISNLNYRGSKINLQYTLKPNNKLEVRMDCVLGKAARIKVLNDKGKVIAGSKEASLNTSLSFSAVNGSINKVIIE